MCKHYDLDSLCKEFNLTDDQKNELSAFVSDYCDNDPLGLYEQIHNKESLRKALRTLKNTVQGQGYTRLTNIIKNK